MITVDTKVRFDPFEKMTGFSSELNRGQMVTGKVVYVNYPHRWFSVEYGNKQRTSFQFSAIGKEVKVVGGI